METKRSDVTLILEAVSAGDARAADRLFPLVYDELRELAERSMRAESPGNTLQATALVHEAYLRLLGEEGAKWQDRGYFFGTAAKAMRRILVERARKKGRVKHGGDLARVSLTDVDLADGVVDADWEAIDSAVDALNAVDADARHVFELRFFAGLTVEATALAMGVSEPTVKRNWAYARAWLADRIGQPSKGAHA